MKQSNLHSKQLTTTEGDRKMSIQELKAKIEEASVARDYTIEVERDIDKFDLLSDELSRLRSQLYKVELREYIAAL